MGVDWAAIDREIQDAAKATDERLAGRIASSLRLTDSEVKQLFPTEADVKKLAELMEIVAAGTAQSEKVNQLASNIQRLGSTVVLLLGKLAL